MSSRSRFIKIRVSPIEHAGIVRQADAAGQTMSDYVRSQMLAVHAQLDILEELTGLRALVKQPAATANDALALETVLLLRELAAGRDAQILSRVRAQLAQTRGTT